MKNYGLGLFLLLLLGAACQSNLSQKETTSQEVDADSLSAQEALYGEVMEIHDAVMPRMSDIMSLNKKLKAVQETSNEDSEKLTELATDLESASEGMMNWMRQFNPQIENMDPDEAMRYLNEEKKKITTVKVEMETAIEKADAFLQMQRKFSDAQKL